MNYKGLNYMNYRQNLKKKVHQKVKLDYVYPH